MTQISRRKLISLALGAVLLGAFPISMQAEASEKVVLRLGWASSDAERDTFAIAARAFKRELEANGDFSVELYPNRQIGDEKQLVEGLRLGSVDAAVLTNAAYAQMEPAFQVNDLPFLYASEAQVFEVLDGELGNLLSSRIEDRGILVLNYLSDGYRHMLNNIKPVYLPSDVEGIKFRVHSAVAVDLYNELGASPVPMAWGETMTALQRGAVDGLDMDIVTTNTLKIYEAVKYMSLTSHTYSGAALGMSKRTFDKLDDNQKKAVLNAADVATAEQRKKNAENSKKLLEALAATGLQINEVPESAKFREKVLPVYEKLRSTIGSDVLDLALSQVSK